MIFRYALALALAAALSGAFGPGLAEAQSPSPPAAAAPSAPAQPVPAPETATGAAVPRVEAAPDGEGFTLSADFEVPLTRALAKAVDRGVPLYFVLEFELYRPRWWWYDELVAARSQTWRLAYHALTRQYRVRAGGVIHPFESLDAALQEIAHVRNWRILTHADPLEPGVVYEAQVRLRLDTSQLPKPFQIRGLTNRDWNPQVEWKRFRFTLPTPRNAQ